MPALGAAASWIWGCIIAPPCPALVRTASAPLHRSAPYPPRKNTHTRDSCLSRLPACLSEPVHHTAGGRRCWVGSGGGRHVFQGRGVSCNFCQRLRLNGRDGQIWWWVAPKHRRFLLTSDWCVCARTAKRRRGKRRRRRTEKQTPLRPLQLALIIRGCEPNPNHPGPVNIIIAPLGCSVRGRGLLSSCDFFFLFFFFRISHSERPKHDGSDMKTRRRQTHRNEILEPLFGYNYCGSGSNSLREPFKHSNCTFPHHGSRLLITADLLLELSLAVTHCFSL